MGKIKCIAKRPDSLPYVTWISNNLKNLQKFVGGYIETVTITSDVVIICNEEGRLKGLNYNCEVLGYEFVGPILFCGIKGDEFESIPLSFDEFKEVFPKLFEDWRNRYVKEE